MKKRWFLSLLLILFIISGIFVTYFGTEGKTAEQDDFKPYPKWTKMVARFDKENHALAPDPIVFLGDSLTERFQIDHYFPNKYVVNRGIGGETTSGLIHRLDSTVLQLQPSKIFLMIGINDIGHGIDKQTIIYHHNVIVKLIQDNIPDTTVYIQSILPVGRQKIRRNPKFNRETIIWLNHQLKKLAEKNDMEFLNLSDLFAGTNGYMIQKYSNDGIHLTPGGYNIWADAVRKAVNK